MKIRMIGYGRLGKILAQQWCENHQVIVSSPSLNHTEIKKNLHGRTSNMDDLDADFLILAVKPHLIKDILLEISSKLTSKTLIISLAAGITQQQLETYLPQHPIIRAMPNINAEVQASATLLLKNEALQLSQKNQIETLFSLIGTFYWVESDHLLDIGTILASSGPAYVFYLMEAFQRAAKSLGMDEQLSYELLTQTFLGSAKLAQHRDQAFNLLMDSVISPKGTTEAALNTMTSLHVHATIQQTLNSAWQRILSIRKSF